MERGGKRRREGDQMWTGEKRKGMRPIEQDQPHEFRMQEPHAHPSLGNTVNGKPRARFR